MADPPAHPARARRLPRAGGPVHRGDADEEYYLHFAGLQGRRSTSSRSTSDYGDLTTLDAATGLGPAVNGDRGDPRALALRLQGYLGNLTREHAGARRPASSRPSSRRPSTARRSRTGCCGRRWRTSPTATSGARSRTRGTPSTEEHLNPVHLEAAAIVREAVPQLGAPTYVELHRRFGFRLDELADQCRDFLDVDRAAVRGRPRPALPRARVGVALAEARALGRRAAVPRARVGPGVPGRPDAAGARGARSPTSAIDLRAQPNVELDVEQREKKIAARVLLRRSRCRSRVVLVIQPIGGADDWRALFHEAGHTEHFATPVADLRWRSGGSATTPSPRAGRCCSSTSSTSPAWLTRRLDVPAPGGVRRRGRDRAPLLRPPLLREAALRARAASRPTTRRRCRKRYVELLGDALKIEPSPTDYLADVDRGLLRHRVPARLGVRGAARVPPARAVRQRLVRAARGRLAPPRAVVARPAADRGRAPRADVTRRSRSTWPS